MDRKGIAILVITFGLLVSWPMLVNKIYPPKPGSGTNTLAAATNVLTGTNAAPGGGSVVNNPVVPVLTATPTPPPTLLTAAEETLTIENDKLRATITSRGGGLGFVELKDYLARIPRNKSERSLPSELATLNEPAFLPAFTYANSPELTGDGYFKLSKVADGVRAEKTLTNGLRLVRQFTIASNYLLHVSTRIENPGTAPVSVPAQELVVGTAAPMDAHETAEWQGLYWFNGEKSEHIAAPWFQNASLGGCVPGTPRPVYEGGSSNVVWAAVHNRFFTMIAVPDQPALKVVARDYPLPAPTVMQLEADGRLNPKPQAHQTALVYPGTTLAPGAALEQKFSLYAGPKEYFTLSRLSPKLDLVMDYTGFTGFFAQALLLSLNFLHQLIPSYGWCIIALTIIIKGLFWPLTAISTRSMKKMQAIQPQLQAVREKFKDNPQKLNQKTLEVMKENGVNPAAGCLPMLVQFPVFIGFFFMLRTAIELRGETFLWVYDLSQPDTLFTIPGLGWIPFLGVAGVGLPFNLLPILMGATSLWMSSMTPVSPQMDPVQQKMMKYMPVFFVLFLYNYSSGLTLYWTAQNLLSVLQTKLTKMNDAKQPAAPVPVAKKR
jgi:YidC/Oxa1 family membrane protein insertase